MFGTFVTNLLFSKFLLSNGTAIYIWYAMSSMLKYQDDMVLKAEESQRKSIQHLSEGYNDNDSDDTDGSTSEHSDGEYLDVIIGGGEDGDNFGKFVTTLLFSNLFASKVMQLENCQDEILKEDERKGDVRESNNSDGEDEHTEWCNNARGDEHSAEYNETDKSKGEDPDPSKNLSEGEFPFVGDSDGVESEGEQTCCYGDISEGEVCDERLKDKDYRYVSEENICDEEIPNAISDGYLSDGEIPNAISEGNLSDGEIPNAISDGYLSDGEIPNAISEGYLSDGEIPNAISDGYLSDGEIPNAISDGYLSDGEIPNAISDGYLSDGEIPNAISDGYLSDGEIPNAISEGNLSDGEIPNAISDGYLSDGELYLTCDDKLKYFRNTYEGKRWRNEVEEGEALKYINHFRLVNNMFDEITKVTRWLFQEVDDMDVTQDTCTPNNDSANTTEHSTTDIIKDELSKCMSTASYHELSSYSNKMSSRTVSSISPNNSICNPSRDQLNVYASNLLADEYKTSIPNTLLEESNVCEVSKDLLIENQKFDEFPDGCINEKLCENTLAVAPSSIVSKRKKNIFLRFCNFVSKKLKRN